jgi:hypothetical protein
MKKRRIVAEVHGADVSEENILRLIVGDSEDSRTATEGNQAR